MPVVYQHTLCICIQVSGSSISWQIDGETMETVRDLIFLGCKITADGDCSHEIKRHFLLGTPGGGNGSLLQYSCLDNPHGQRSLAGYSPWGHKESVTTGTIHACNLSVIIRYRRLIARKRTLFLKLVWNFY